MIRTLSIALLGGWLISCSSPSTTENETAETMMELPADPHSYARPNEARIQHLHWVANVDFDREVIDATATYDLQKTADARELILDTYDLEIESVTDQDGGELLFEVGDHNEILGAYLSIAIEENTSKVSVKYTTSPGARALQWLDPGQTAGKELPFLFTQSQAILARTWIPVQDSPGIRYTYTAEVTVPSSMLALMSATNPTERNESGTYSFSMDQPIPSYLMALSVGDIVFKPVGERTGVYAEPSLVDTAAWEFGRMEDMLIAAEELYGPYAWDRYDVIVLPPSFPFGGMENPRLTFATPTILAGDRSLTALIAHELAHSWSGNLVTNATWNDFWLNEGFTVYFEQRIMEAVRGRNYAEMLISLGRQDLEGTVAEMGDSHDSHLKLDLAGRDPDDGLTDIAYEKGNFLLKTIEQAVGREAFDAFLKSYFERHKFQVMDTERFIEEVNAELLTTPSLREEVRIEEWIYEPGLPDNAPVYASANFEAVDAQIDDFAGGAAASALVTDNWTTHEWLRFIRNLPGELSVDQLSDLDGTFGFTASGNNEILAAWFQKTIPNGYAPADERVERFLIEVGRRKFLTPTYKALVEADPSKDRARAIYAQARPNYHAVSRQTMDALLDWSEE